MLFPVSCRSYLMWHFKGWNACWYGLFSTGFKRYLFSKIFLCRTYRDTWRSNLLAWGGLIVMRLCQSRRSLQSTMLESNLQSMPPVITMHQSGRNSSIQQSQPRMWKSRIWSFLRHVLKSFLHDGARGGWSCLVGSVAQQTQPGHFWNGTTRGWLHPATRSRNTWPADAIRSWFWISTSCGGSR